MRIEMVGVQAHLLGEVADSRMKRDDVAVTYAFALVSSEEIDWPAINRAIIDRWSLSALKYIKEKAWRLVEKPA